MNAVMRLVAICLLASQVVSQQTWKVDCNGAPGSHFTDLPAAVAAAAPGDTILVYITYPTGTCSQYTAPTITKPLSIVGFWTGLSPGTNQTNNLHLNGPLSISGIGPGEKVLLTNLSFSHSPLPHGTTIAVTDCAGTVVFEDIAFGNSGYSGQVVRFERCSNVVLRGCEFDVGGAPIEFIDTTAQLTTTKVLSVAPSPWWPYPYTRETLYLLRSRVTVVGSKVEGPWYSGSSGYVPYQAAVLDASTLRIGATSIVHGGYTGPPPWGVGYWFMYSMVGPHPSVVERDPRAPVFPTYWVYPAPVPKTIDETFHDWVVADESFQVRTYGPPGGTAMLFVGDHCHPRRAAELSIPTGILGVEPSTAILLDTVPLSPTTGLYSWTMFCPAWVPVGHAFAFQCLTISPSGVLGLTEPSPVLVGWDKDRLP